MSTSPHRTVMVTGSLRSLGWEISKHYAGQGARLLCHHHRSGQDLEDRSKELLSLGAQEVTFFERDLSRIQGLEEDVWRLFQRAGSVDVLVHNASFYRDDDVATATLSHWEESLNLHATSPWILSRALAQQAREGAEILTILDASLPRKKGFFTYQMGKTLLAELTRQMAAAWAPKVRVNGLALGAFLSNPIDRNLEKWVLSLPIPRWGRPEDLTKALRFLSEATFVTGQVLYLDGGLHLRKA